MPGGKIITPKNRLLIKRGLKGYRFAQEMRCDRYAECSAVTGELMREVMEDIARTAAKTTTEAGGLSTGSMGGCAVM